MPTYVPGIHSRSPQSDGYRRYLLYYNILGQSCGNSIYVFSLFHLIVRRVRLLRKTGKTCVVRKLFPRFKTYFIIRYVRLHIRIQTYFFWKPAPVPIEFFTWQFFLLHIYSWYKILHNRNLYRWGISNHSTYGGRSYPCRRSWQPGRKRFFRL